MICSDSRKIKKGDTFVCIPNPKDKEYCLEAINRGATTLILTTELISEIMESLPPFVKIIATENPRLWRVLNLKKAYQGKQPKYCLAVTGTNGKSSVVHYVHALLSHLDQPNAALGTLGCQTYPHIDDLPIVEPLTTQDPEVFHQLLAKLYDHKIDYLAFEASSHGLDQNRIDGCSIFASGFTNLSHDHLDYHKSMDDYFEAKFRLFSQLTQKISVINGQCPFGQKIHERLGKHCWLYGENQENFPLFFNQAVISLFEETLPIKEMSIQTPLHLKNILCAAGLIIATGVKPSEVINYLPRLRPPPGRLQEVSKNIFVDYAHTPHALYSILYEIRKMKQGRLITVFGCGGNRDAEKRPLMGKIATEFSDVVIVTDDNPRLENAQKIRKEVLKGCKGKKVLEIGDRFEAILKAIQLMDEKDVLIVAGKGHETYQEIGDKKFDFDDQKVIQVIIADQMTRKKQKRAVSNKG